MLRERCTTGRSLVLEVDLRHKIVGVSKDELIKEMGGNKSVKGRIARARDPGGNGVLVSITKLFLSLSLRAN